MSDYNELKAEIFGTLATEPTTDQIVDVITGQVSPDEQERIIRLIFAEQTLIEEFAELWDQLLPEYGGQNPRITLDSLLKLIAAGRGDIEFRGLIEDDESPTWLRSWATAYSEPPL